MVFEKELISVPGKPQAALICPGHPLLDAVIDLVLDQHRDLLKQGSILVDPHDEGETMRVLFYLEHTIQDASLDTAGKRRESSRANCNSSNWMSKVTRARQVMPRSWTIAPYMKKSRRWSNHCAPLPWLKRDLEEQARINAITELVPRHLAEIKQRREDADRQDDGRRQRAPDQRDQLLGQPRRATARQQEALGKTNAHLNSQKARQTAEELLARLERRMHELQLERQLSPLPPVVVGGVLVIPQGLLKRLAGPAQDETPDSAQFARETARIEQLAMEAVMQAELAVRLHPARRERRKMWL